MSTLTTTITATELGGSVPSLPHAISVSLPTWKDNIDYEEGAKRVVDSMKTGYPRFFIHRSIQLLSNACERKFGLPTERALLFPNATVASACRTYIRNHSATAVSVRLVQYMICPQSSTAPPSTPTTHEDFSVVPSPCQSTEDSVELHIVFFPAEIFPLAKSFWQHTGDGISSRMAEKCLEFLGINPAIAHDARAAPNGQRANGVPASSVGSRYGRGLHKGSAAARKGGSISSIPIVAATPPKPVEEPDVDDITKDHTNYLEERYGRNMPLSSYSVAKRALRRRIAGVLLRDSNSPSDPVETLGGAQAVVGESWRGVQDVSESDVFLYPTGMSAIWHAHQLALGTAEKMGKVAGKSICFGFPYTDTLKILQKWGPGCHFLGHGLDSDLPELRRVLEASRQPSSSSSPPQPILALFCEFPSNPLLRSPNLAELRKLADEFDFLIVVDETIGNFVNVDVLKHADIVVSSLTKVFSGETNVMGGSLVLNPEGRRAQILHEYLSATYEDTYWPEDAVFMERNSRDFQRRIDVINHNAETIADLLRSQSAVYSGQQNRVIKEVYYPKWITRENFDVCRTKPSERVPYQGGFGGLLSISFTSATAAQVFFDSLACEKGPSLGTNFTLACPYTVLAHYNELDWAKGWGVDPQLVRVSVGMEDQQTLLKWFGDAIRAAEVAVAK